MLPARFYPIAPDCDTAQSYIDRGVRFLQIRLKDMPDQSVRDQLRQAIHYAKHHDTALVINDYWHYAIEYGAEWIHLGQEDLQDADLKAIRHHNIKLGISTHDIPELENALKHNPDYIALGPIYFTKLKAMKWNPQGLERIAEWKEHCGMIPLVAIGGITLEKAEGVLQAGADCVSFVTDITHHQNPQKRLEAWIEHFS